jgi:hypothetical protein
MQSAKLNTLSLKVDQHKAQRMDFHNNRQLQSPCGLPALPYLTNLLGLAIADPKNVLEKGGEMC